MLMQRPQVKPVRKTLNHHSTFTSESRRNSVVELSITDPLYWLERCGALLLLALCAPVFMFAMLLISLDSPGPAFFRQKRTGRYGKPFDIVKFRTMVVDAERVTGPVLARRNDSRLTSLGAILRATHLDELPQLWNVFLGQMSFIGPRPERPEFVSSFNSKIAGYDRRHIIRPGITGLAQILLPYDASPEDKLVFDLHYLENRGSFSLKLWIVAQTMAKATSPVASFLRPAGIATPGFPSRFKGNIATP